MLVSCVYCTETVPAADLPERILSVPLHHGLFRKRGCIDDDPFIDGTVPSLDGTVPLNSVQLFRCST